MLMLKIVMHLNRGAVISFFNILTNHSTPVN